MSAKLKKLAEAATPGPWSFGVLEWNKKDRHIICVKPFDYYSGNFCDNPGIFGSNGQMIVGCDEYDIFSGEADRAYLTAASPDAVLKLIAERDALYAFAMRVCYGEGDSTRTLIEEGRAALALVGEQT